MKLPLVKKLIEKNILHESTLVETYNKVKTLSCQNNNMILDAFIVDKISVSDDEVKFNISNKNFSLIINHENIISIDGMNEKRICAAYDLTVDGQPKPQGKKRGRKTDAEKLRLSLLKESDEVLSDEDDDDEDNDEDTDIVEEFAVEPIHVELNITLPPTDVLLIKEPETKITLDDLSDMKFSCWMEELTCLIPNEFKFLLDDLNDEWLKPVFEIGMTPQLFLENELNLQLGN